MYSERDVIEIKRRIGRNLAVLIPVAAAILAAYVYALRERVEWLAMLMGATLFVAVCYGLIAYLIPNIRYRLFLRDMQTGLTREMRGTILSVSDQAEDQDGARVLPVHMQLSEDGDERIVYLNAAKADGFPAPGAEVLLRLYGRHIREVASQKG